MTLLKISGVSKSYGEGPTKTDVLHDINLEMNEGEFVAIVGFSGSGKTTLISLIAGLLEPSAGSVEFDGKPVTGAGPDRGVIFQNYSLLPWLTVYENVVLAVDNVFPQWDKAKRRAHAEKYIEMVNLTPAVGKKPHELSGGMRQRVSVARALAMTPRMLLLDEPLGALDALTRGTLQKEIGRIICGGEDKKTALLITNDVDEAILLADRIIPLKPGPNATLGPSFDVKLSRPRHASELNKNVEFKRIRNELTEYLIECRRRNRERDSDNPSGLIRIKRPTAQPIDLNAA